MEKLCLRTAIRFSCVYDESLQTKQLLKYTFYYTPRGRFKIIQMQELKKASMQFSIKQQTLKHFKSFCMTVISQLELSFLVIFQVK